jgi:two-component sensor histidine kinase
VCSSALRGGENRKCDWRFATRVEGDCGLQTPGLGVLWITVDQGHADLIRSLRNYVPLPTKALSIIALVLASTVIISGLAVWTLSDFSDFRSDAETIVAATAHAVDDVAVNSLQAIDGVLESVVIRIEEKGIDILSSEAERENLRRFARRLPATGTIVVDDNAGNIVAAVPSLQSPLNDSDQEWFRSLKEGRAEPHVGRAKGDMVHGLFFPVARWVRGPDGAFVGAVQVGVGLTYFAQVFRSLDVGFRSLDVRSDAKLGVYRTTDGAVVARFPLTETLLDETVATSPYFSLLANSEGQSWTGWTRIGGQMHLVSARHLIGWPLIVSVSLPEGEVYAGVWTRLLWRSVAAATAIAALSILTVLAARQARREAALMGELEHRVKNTLAVVAAVIERARENAQSIDEFVASLRGRIRSMAGTQTLLSQSRWRGVSVANLIRAELNPYATDTNTSVEGPTVHLAPTASLAVAMVLHELATNAAKYGALSQRGGHVSVRWTLTAVRISAAMLRIEWEETGGPEVALPARQGYGSSVIRDLLTHELGGRVDLVFAANGVRCTIEMPTTGATIG